MGGRRWPDKVVIDEVPDKEMADGVTFDPLAQRLEDGSG
jgi:hypothetical protein